MPSQRRPSSADVTVISANAETIDGLHAYLRGAGVSSRAVRSLREVGGARAPGTPVVIFPDEFEPGDVIAGIDALRAARPSLLIVVVTSAPQRYRPALGPDGTSLPPVVLPKPAFGWTILDAVRAHASRPTEVAAGAAASAPRPSGPTPGRRR